MIHIKFIHTLLGLLSLLLFAVLSFAPSALLPSFVQSSANDADTVLLLATTGANICLGLYVSSHYGIKRKVQIFASFLIIISAFFAVYTAFNPTYTVSSFTLGNITQALLVAGTVLYFLINLNALNPSPYSHEIEEGRETGTVKWFNVSKGFGFITRDVGGDVFVHYRAIRGSGHRALREGQRVDFTVIENNKGLQAEDVIAAARGR